MSLKDQAIMWHQKNRGKIATLITTPINNREDLSLAYTPGVGEVSREIAENKERVYELTIKSHTIAVVTDGSAVLGLGNIGPEASLPVMEGKAALFKTFDDLDAFPIALNTQDTDEIVNIVKAIAPVFGGINLEDIAAPRCFEIEERLQNIGIPVTHDDQHGTAVVTLAGLINASKVVDKKMSELTVVISGAGAAGHAVANLVKDLVKDIIMVDRKGIISKSREDLDKYKQELLTFTNKNNQTGSLRDALKNSDVFIGVSAPNILTADDIRLMADDAIVFAMANPIPEIMPDLAKEGGAKVIATGRSDFPNQINNSLAFPGIFKGALEKRATQITMEMKQKAAYALADLVPNPTVDKIIPGPFDEGVTKAVSQAVASCV